MKVFFFYIKKILNRGKSLETKIEQKLEEKLENTLKVEKQKSEVILQSESPRVNIESLADPGEARGYSTNTSVIKSFIH